MEVELHEIVGRDVVDVLANFDRCASGVIFGKLWMGP